MKHFIRISLLFLCILLLCPPAVQAQDDNPWKAVPTCIFGMPAIGHAVKKNGTGVIIDILKAVYEAEKIPLKHVELPYKRAIEGVMSGEIHCTLDIKDNRKGVLQGTATIATYDLAAAYLRKTGFAGINDLAGKKVAYLHGFDIQAFLPVKVIPQLVYDLSSAYHMLEREHAAYILDDIALLKDAMFESKLPTVDFEMSPIESYEVRPIFAPTDAGRRFRDIYDRRMKEMFVSGEFAEIMKANGIKASNIQRVLDLN